MSKGPSHERIARDRVIKQSSEKSFGYLLGGICIAVGLWPLLSHLGVRWGWFILGLSLALIGFLKPSVLAPINKMWLKIALLLERIVTPMIMGVVFFLVVTPMALLLKILGKDLLGLRQKTNQKSYWTERPTHLDDKQHFELQH